MLLFVLDYSSLTRYLVSAKAPTGCTSHALALSSRARNSSHYHRPKQARNTIENTSGIRLFKLAATITNVSSTPILPCKPVLMWSNSRQIPTPKPPCRGYAISRRVARAQSYPTTHLRLALWPQQFEEEGYHHQQKRSTRDLHNLCGQLSDPSLCN